MEEGFELVKKRGNGKNVLKGKFIIFDSIRVGGMDCSGFEAWNFNECVLGEQMKYGIYGQMRRPLIFPSKQSMYLTYENEQQAAVAFLGISEVGGEIQVGYRMQSVCENNQGSCSHELKGKSCGFLHSLPKQYHYVNNVSKHQLPINSDTTPIYLNQSDLTDWLYRNKAENRFYRKAVMLSHIHNTFITQNKFVEGLNGTPNKHYSDYLPHPYIIYQKVRDIIKSQPSQFKEEGSIEEVKKEKKKIKIPGLNIAKELEEDRGARNDNILEGEERKWSGVQEISKKRKKKRDNKAKNTRRMGEELGALAVEKDPKDRSQIEGLLNESLSEFSAPDTSLSLGDDDTIHKERKNTSNTQIEEFKVWADVEDRQQERIELELNNTLGGTEIDNERFVCTGVLNTGRRVAIKALKKELHKEITNELQLLVLLDSHPNIIRYFDKFAIYRKSVVGVKYPIEYYVIPIELCAGSIADYIAYVGFNRAQSTINASIPDYTDTLSLKFHDLNSIIEPNYDPKFIKWLMKDALKGLIFLHSTGRDKQPVIHRDIKPQNILITYDKQAKISDFGISRAKITDKTIGEGTYRYMAPEIWKEPTRLSQAADIFALGATFYYMMVGHHLFQEAAYILSEENYDLSELRESKHWKWEAREAESILHKMLRKNPSERPLPTQIADDIFFCTDSVAILQRLKEINDHTILAQMTKELDKPSMFPNWMSDLSVLVTPEINLKNYYLQPTDSGLLKFIRHKFCHITEITNKERKYLRVSKTASQEELYDAFLHRVRVACNGVIRRYFEFYEESSGSPDNRLAEISVHRGDFANNPSVERESSNILEIPIWGQCEGLVALSEKETEGVVFESEKLKVLCKMRYIDPMGDPNKGQGVSISIWVLSPDPDFPQYIPSTPQFLSQDYLFEESENAENTENTNTNNYSSSSTHINTYTYLIKLQGVPMYLPQVHLQLETNSIGYLPSICFPLPVYLNRFMRPLTHILQFGELWGNLDTPHNEVLDILLDMSLTHIQWKHKLTHLLSYLNVSSQLDHTRRLINLGMELTLGGICLEIYGQIEAYAHHIRISFRSLPYSPTHPHITTLLANLVQYALHS